MIHVINVYNKLLADSSVYSGEYDCQKDRPFGWGIRKYPNDSEAIGNFIDVPHGPSYINFGTYMKLGFFSEGKLNGWGMSMGNGSYLFGIFSNGKLIKDCTYLMEETHEHITSLSRSIRAKGVSVKWAHCFTDNRAVFFGVAQKGYYMIGIRFLKSGDIYIGRSRYNLDITGTFLHIKGHSYESGVFEKGILISKTDGFIAHNASWIEWLHTDKLSFTNDEIAILNNTLKYEDDLDWEDGIIP